MYTESDELAARIHRGGSLAFPNHRPGPLGLCRRGRGPQRADRTETNGDRSIAKGFRNDHTDRASDDRDRRRSDADSLHDGIDARDLDPYPPC